MDVEGKFKEIIADIFGVEVRKLKTGTRFIDDLNAKSVDVIAMIAATENTFGIKVPSQEANKNKTIGQAVAYIKRKLRK